LILRFIGVNIRSSMSKTSHYKYLKKHEELYNYSVNDLTNESVLKIDNPDILRHYDLLRLDEIKKVYEPYIEDAKDGIIKLNAI